MASLTQKNYGMLKFVLFVNNSSLCYGAALTKGNAGTCRKLGEVSKQVYVGCYS